MSVINGLLPWPYAPAEVGERMPDRSKVSGLDR